VKLDIEGLTITLTSSSAKSKKTGGVEILSDAQLRLKAGQRYALIGRNGCGKSSLSSGSDIACQPLLLT
jgi:ABC-type sugar transport system ATPase subunit